MTLGVGSGGAAPDLVSLLQGGGDPMMGMDPGMMGAPGMGAPVPDDELLMMLLEALAAESPEGRDDPPMGFAEAPGAHVSPMVAGAANPEDELPPELLAMILGGGGV